MRSLRDGVQRAYGYGDFVARTGSHASRLHAGGPTPQPLGPLKQLAVQKGDVVRLTAPGFYPHPVQVSSFAFSLAAFVAGLVQQQPAVPGGPDGSGRTRPLPLLSIGVSAGLPALAQAGGGVPKGYVRLLVFDADSNLVSSQTQTRQLTSAARTNYEALSVQVIAQQDGYVTAYVGNESNADVYFDDVQVEHRQGLQIQETQYDPTGLELAGLGTSTPGLKPLNQYKFNGKEFQADLGLNWNHQDWRFFDAQLGRWHVVDPEIENGQESWTPYSFGFDNAVRYADADGRKPGDPWYRQAAEWASNLLKGVDAGTNQRYQTYPPGGDTRFGIQDTKAGRVSKTTGRPVGAPVIRFDVADKVTKYPHVNYNPVLRGKPDNIPHTPIPGGASTLKGLEVRWSS